MKILGIVSMSTRNWYDQKVVQHDNLTIVIDIDVKTNIKTTSTEIWIDIGWEVEETEAGTN